MYEALIKMTEPQPPAPEGEKLENLARKGYELFQQYYPELQQHYRGQVVAIDPISGDYYTGKDGNEVLQKAEKEHPDTLFYMTIIPKSDNPRRRIRALQEIL